MPLWALTACQAFFDHGDRQAGQRVLIHGGAGGVGSFAVQLARWRGTHVVATPSARDADLVQELGADEVVDYRAQLLDIGGLIDGGHTAERGVRWKATRSDSGRPPHIY